MSEIMIDDWMVAHPFGIPLAQGGRDDASARSGSGFKHHTIEESRESESYMILVDEAARSQAGLRDNTAGGTISRVQQFKGKACVSSYPKTYEGITRPCRLNQTMI
ncbi:uncharacterized protein CLUP02_01813 [Colletotrichum lupini]|uniref:Uncharacterized protein n=1 Tax=Colletotrichum lupini TaxID=145971 RepID=A0A9Q8SDU0_9PEZI|nr:uncharacterized protein CLUP02_01813 [Colletotrichum lupini]UQC75160.1 hypothetical protein CLUP02_01813 [Colletotrichum lupini]